MKKIKCVVCDKPAMDSVGIIASKDVVLPSCGDCFGLWRDWWAGEIKQISECAARQEKERILRRIGKNLLK